MMTRRILVVDDDRGTCRFVSKVLSGRGWRVDVANNGDQALALVRSNPYNLALLDYLMPGINGVELFRQIAELQPDMVGAFITAHARIDTVYPAVAAGIERVLAKPVQSDELVALVDELLGQSDPE